MNWTRIDSTRTHPRNWFVSGAILECTYWNIFMWHGSIWIRPCTVPMLQCKYRNGALTIGLITMCAAGPQIELGLSEAASCARDCKCSIFNYLCRLVMLWFSKLFCEAFKMYFAFLDNLFFTLQDLLVLDASTYLRWLWMATFLWPVSSREAIALFHPSRHHL